MGYGNTLKQLLNGDDVVIVPGVHDPLTARVVENAGRFDAFLMTGYGTSLSTVGLPDAGLMTMNEAVRNAKAIQETVDVPVIADADDGYGNAINVIRTTREFVAADVAGILLEDQASPKRCGNVKGKRVVSREEAVGKIRAAVDTRDRLDPDFVVVGRTDARGAVGGSLDEAIERANAFLDAGADATFVHGPADESEGRRIGAEIDGPSVYVCSGSVPYRDSETFAEWGIDLVVYPRLSIQASIVSLYENARLLASDGNDAVTALEAEFDALPIGGLDEFAGFPQIVEWEEEYLPEEDLEKYHLSEGFEF